MEGNEICDAQARAYHAASPSYNLTSSGKAGLKWAENLWWISSTDVDDFVKIHANLIWISLYRVILSNPHVLN